MLQTLYLLFHFRFRCSKERPYSLGGAIIFEGTVGVDSIVNNYQGVLILRSQYLRRHRILPYSNILILQNLGCNLNSIQRQVGQMVQSNCKYFGSQIVRTLIARVIVNGCLAVNYARKKAPS